MHDLQFRRLYELCEWCRQADSLSAYAFIIYHSCWFANITILPRRESINSCIELYEPQIKNSMDGSY